MKLHIYYQKNGRIVSLVEVKEDIETPPAGIFAIPECEDTVIELTDEQAKIPLIALHVGYTVDPTQKEPRLVPIKPRRDMDKEVK